MLVDLSWYRWPWNDTIPLDSVFRMRNDSWLTTTECLSFVRIRPGLCLVLHKMRAEALSASEMAHDVGKEYEIPPPVPPTSFGVLKERIRHHYEISSDYYYSLWWVPSTTSQLLEFLFNPQSLSGGSMFIMATFSRQQIRRNWPRPSLSTFCSSALISLLTLTSLTLDVA